MHCSPQQQQKLAKSLLNHLGEKLLSVTPLVLHTVSCYPGLDRPSRFLAVRRARDHRACCAALTKGSAISCHAQGEGQAFKGFSGPVNGVTGVSGPTGLSEGTGLSEVTRVAGFTGFAGFAGFAGVLAVAGLTAVTAAAKCQTAEI